ncbi:MAG: bis(5'-nucleosyl)-tetraphosphatase (symmetrical) YqeK [Treponemataceae bacterium]|nr:bis(5'-nucleosyl)-tetraphosphatase (symmetrical) YqeK [Treponemataceae bacterium]
MAPHADRRNILRLAEKVRRHAKESVSKSRYRHSVRTAETAVRLCLRYGLDEDSGYLAGIAHDMCKDWSAPLLLKAAAQDGAPISSLEWEEPAFLHGRAAAVLLRTKFGVDDEDVIEAVAVHTFGRIGMCPLAKAVYIADKIEPGRDCSSESALTRLLELDLDGLLKKILSDGICFLKEKGKAVAPESEQLLESLR